MSQLVLIMAQAPQQGYAQTEYIAAVSLTIALVVLGLIAVCAPRPRARHFVEPEENEAKPKKGRSR